MLLTTFSSLNAQSNNEDRLSELVKKAKKAGLEEDRIAHFLDLIAQKEQDLLAIKNSNNDDSVYGLLESPLKKTNTEVRMEFAKNLANLITKDEYASILDRELKKGATVLAQKEMKNVISAHELSEDQKQKVYALIADYYLNESITKSYYVFDKKLKEQKLTALRFYFEKNYRNLMESFGIILKSSKKANTNTFQY
jgi:hypothetical protein